MPVEQHTRPPLARMLKIHEQLQRDRAPTCTSLAHDLEVSVKTVQRDIDFMRDQLRMPVEYDAGRRGYRYTQEVTAFPTVNVSEGEIVSLLVAQKALEQYRGTPFEKLLESSFAKLCGALSGHISFHQADILQTFSFRTVGAAKVEVATFETLAHAIREHRVLTIQYRKASAEQAEERRLEPLHLTNIEGLWYLIARDVAKAALRTFALTRIVGSRVERTRFTPPEDFSVEQYLAGAFGAFAGPDQLKVRIRFDRFAAAFIRERDWHPSQKITARADGGLEISFQVGRLEEVENWVLSWGAHARVLAPKILAVRIQAVAAQMVAAYE
jgi:predicted DNA-binding transcriptional regulator YafY